MTHSFLPVSQKDMEQETGTSLDFLFISADAYVDHPSFGHAIIRASLIMQALR